MDLTIEIKEDCQLRHLGVVTTAQINKWINEIPTLSSITVLLKYELTRKGLNETYVGGINTYCLVVMIVSFIKKQGLQKQQNLGIVLGQLLKFYGWQFNEKVYGIDLRMEKQIFYVKDTKEGNKFANLQVKDPLYDGKVMTRNCYQFNKIKQIFQSVYQFCFARKEKFLKDYLSSLKKKMSRRKTKEESETESGS